MTTELMSLTLVALFTSLMWLPYMVNVVGVRGVADALGYPSNPIDVALWASRVDRAHRKAVENLAIFAPLALIAHVAGISNETTVMAGVVYSFARVVHFFTLVLAVPVIKSLSFMVGSACQIVLAFAILMV